MMIIRVIVVLNLIFLQLAFANSFALSIIESIVISSNLLLIDFRYEHVGFPQLTSLNVVCHMDCFLVVGLNIEGHLMAFLSLRPLEYYQLLGHSIRQHSTYYMLEMIVFVKNDLQWQQTVPVQHEVFVVKSLHTVHGAI